MYSNVFIYKSLDLLFRCSKFCRILPKIGIFHFHLCGLTSNAIGPLGLKANSKSTFNPSFKTSWHNLKLRQNC